MHYVKVNENCQNFYWLKNQHEKGGTKILGVLGDNSMLRWFLEENNHTFGTAAFTCNNSAIFSSSSPGPHKVNKRKKFAQHEAVHDFSGNRFWETNKTLLGGSTLFLGSVRNEFFV